MMFPKQPILGRKAVGHGPSPLPSLFDLPHVRTRSGRSALLLALQLLDVKRGERVLVPTYHCPFMISPVVALGATPVFYPITATGVPDLDVLAGRVDAPVRAMLVPHLFGLPISLSATAQFCRERNIVLIEDCAHAFFGSHAGTPIGSTGDFAIGSLPKFFPVTEGGVLASANRSLQPLRSTTSPVRELRAAWNMVETAANFHRLGMLGTLIRSARRRKQVQSSNDAVQSEPTSEDIRRESLRDPLLPVAPLTNVESWLADRTNSRLNVTARQANFRALAQALGDVRGARPLFSECGEHAAPYVMPLWVQDPEEPYARMRRRRLPVFRWDRIWPGTPADSRDAGVAWQREVIQIACHQSLSPEEILQVAHQVRDCVLG